MKKNKSKTGFYFFFVALLAFFGYHTIISTSVFWKLKSAYVSYKAESRFSIKKNLMNLIPLLNANRSKVLLIGDSRSIGVKCQTVYNASIRGLQMFHLKTFQTDGLKNIEVLILSLGINDILAGYETDYILENYSKWVNSSLIKNEKCSIYILLPLEVTNVDLFLRSSENINNQIRLFNTQITDVFGDISRVQIVQITKLNRDIFASDGIHFSKRGNELYSNAVCNEIIKIRMDEY